MGINRVTLIPITNHNPQRLGNCALVVNESKTKTNALITNPISLFIYQIILPRRLRLPLPQIAWYNISCCASNTTLAPF